MRRQRRSRIDAKVHNQILSLLIHKATTDNRIVQYISEGNKNKAFGKLLNKWLDSTQESIIDRYIDKDACNITWYAINTLNKQLRN